MSYASDAFWAKQFPQIMQGQSPEGMTMPADMPVLRQEAGFPAASWAALNEGGNARLRDGFLFQGTTMPGPDLDGTYGGVKGRWNYQGDEIDGMGGKLQNWIFEGEKAPQAQAAPQQIRQEKPVEPQKQYGDIYTDWDAYQSKARDQVEGINRMPFVFSNYDQVSLDPQRAMDMFYPGAWQEQGVQKTIGPNGQNIGPDLYNQFGDAQAIDTTVPGQDWPSLVKMLLGNGSISGDQSQSLLGMMAPKKLDQSFAGQALLGAKR